MSFKFLDKPLRSDYERIITEDYILTDNSGNCQLLYTKLEDISDLMTLSRTKDYLNKADIKLQLFDKYKTVIDSYIDQYFSNRPHITRVYFRKNQDIGYHKDKVPGEGSLTATICIRHKVKGGELVIPDFKIAVAQDHGYLCIFDGKRHHHGVKSMKVEPGGYRSVFVFHS